LVGGKASVFCTQTFSTPSVPAHLVKLEPAPDLVDRVYRALIEAISDGRIEPGARLTQEDVAARLSVSRQPVLQALRLLKNDGLVVDAPGRGVLVAPLDAALKDDVYEERGALDALAARLAAGRQAVIDSRLVVTGRRAARGKSIQAMVDADLAFHEAIYAASGNPLIAQSARLHWAHLRRVMALSCNTRASARRCGTSTRRSPTRSAPATPIWRRAASTTMPGAPG
jgi:DNA-binding GntR family transcriptional regulator